MGNKDLSSNLGILDDATLLVDVVEPLQCCVREFRWLYESKKFGINMKRRKFMVL